MKSLIAVLAVISLTGCAVGVKTLAWMYDGADACQARNNGGNYPSYCGAGNARTYVINNRVVTVQGP